MTRVGRAGRRGGTGRGARGLALAAAVAAALAVAPERAVGAPGEPAAKPGEPAAAGSSEPLRVVILELRFSGIAPDLAQRYEDVLGAQLKSFGFDVIERKEARALLDKLGAPPNCTVGPCLKQVGSILGAHRVVVGVIAAQGSNYDTTLTLLETGRGNAVAQALEHCEVCTVDEGLRSFGRVVASLNGRPTGPKSTTPVRTTIWREHPLPWYQRPVWRIGAFAVGLGGLAAGASLLALDGSCASGHNCPRTYKTSVTGIALLAVGGVATGAGVGMLFLHGPPDRGGRVAVGVGPGGLALCGQF